MIHTTSKTVVLCDDEPAILEELTDLAAWNDLGLDVVATATDGLQALNILFEYEPDIAVIDIHMPLMNGIKLLEECKKSDIKTEFIILSGYGDFSYAKSAIKYGAAAYLLKPVNLTELFEELHRLLLKKSDAGTANTSGLDRINHLITSLLSGQVVNTNLIQSILSTANTGLKNRSCYVLAANLDIHSLPNKINLLKALEEEFESLPHFFIPYQGYLVGIFNENREISFKTASRILKILDSTGEGDCSIGGGEGAPSLADINVLYSRAIAALTYRIYLPNSRIFLSHIICEIPPQKTLADMDYLPLVQFIVRHDKENIIRYVDRFIEDLLYVKMPPPNYLFSTCYALFSTIERDFSQYTKDEIRTEHGMQTLYDCKSIGEIAGWLKASFLRLSEFIDAVYGYSGARSTLKEEAAEEMDDIITESMAYIRANITNHLKISDIAKQVHLSTSYFAIYFKNKTKMNLRDFILEEKMEYARKELLHKDKSITEIADRLGYGDYRSFSRAFKNIHHKTPNEFRMNYGK